MHKDIVQFLASRFPVLAAPIDSVLPGLKHFQNSPVALTNQARVLRAFSEYKVSSYDLLGSTGYGYNDSGREKLEGIYTEVFGGESALVRPQIASGTHALWLALSGNTGPGDEIISITGRPYATLDTVLSDTGPGSFRAMNIRFIALELLPDGSFDIPALKTALSEKTKIVYIQKSRGYSLRNSISCRQIGDVAAWLRTQAHSPAIVVDNCYGEFVEDSEPGHAGADLTVGSLIKNPGGGLAETGGYLVGRKSLVENAADRLLAPGLEGQIGATGHYLRGMFQGLFLAPHFVGEAVFNARFAAALAESLGYQVLPKWNAPRYDLVQAIVLNSSQKMDMFCQAIQAASPVDSYVAPVPGDVPGYKTPVLMAAGTFVQGASLELSADGPVAPPYIVYFQGGLGVQHGILAVCSAFSAIGGAASS